MTDRKDVEYDPDGTLLVARGNVSINDKEEDEQATEQLAKLQQQVENDPALQSFLYSTTQPQAAQDRLKMMQMDDQRPNLSNLSDKQRRAFLKRSLSKNTVVAAKLKRHDTKRLQAAIAARDASLVFADSVGYLQAENDMERTTAMKQSQLKKHLDPETAQHIYDLKLACPHGLQYDRSGRYSLLYSTASTSRGHVAVMDNSFRTLQTEFVVQERIRDACFLNNSKLFALAQQQHVYIYDDTGAEIHRLASHIDPLQLEYLPHHWLLASLGRAGHLKYTDTSTGQLVSSHSVGAHTNVLRQNPSNAVLVAGHGNGSVSLWSPSSSTYLAKVMCHKGSPVLSCAIDAAGHSLVTGGADKQVSVWDLRMMKLRHSYYTAAGVPCSLDISQRNMLAIGHAGHVTIWGADALESKVRDPYLHHLVPGGSPIETVRFRPFEDVCGVGHANGITSMVVPGAGEPTFDTNEYHLNPMQSVKQRQEQEVRSLMDKLRPDMIGLDPDQVGAMEESDPHRRLERIQQLQEEANAKPQAKKKQKSKKRGRSKIQTQLRRKQANIVDQNVMQLRQAREKEKSDAEATRNGIEPEPSRKESAPAALRRFF
ncbi:hypothetical protein MPSEU_000337600 [Mayamaea pseudoterrestris]|nr:hypothetical protein MPSEU_000337600 [Mayamaea pseudoterrestris]